MKIETIEQLKKICEETKELVGDQLDCCISNGVFRSSKTFIFQEDSAVVIVNEIDGSTITLNSIEKVMTSKKTNIGKSIRNGTFFVYDYEMEKLSIAKARKQVHQLAKAGQIDGPRTAAADGFIG